MKDTDLEQQSQIISIFAVDPSTLFRQGIRTAMEKHSDIEISGESDISNREVIEMIEQFSPRVALVDVNIPVFNGLDLTRQITQRMPQTMVIVLTPYEDEPQLFQAIKAGAAAYVGKNIDADDLANIIRRVASGELVITESLSAKPRVAERVLKQFHDFSLPGASMESLAIPLTTCEREILSYIAYGYRNKRIAYTLNISEQTIKNHITSILRKLDANDRTHAVVLAIRHGWITMSEREVVPPE